MKPATSTRESSAQLTPQDAINETVYRSFDSEGRHIPAKVIAAAMNLKRGEKRLYDYADELRTAELPAVELASFTLGSGPNFLTLDTIERACGRVAFVVPCVSGAGDVLMLSGRSAKDFGAFLVAIARADADGKWTEDELRQAELRADHLFAAVKMTLSRAADKVREQKGGRR